MDGTITLVNQAKRSIVKLPSYDYNHQITLDGSGNIGDVLIPDLSSGLIYQVETTPDGDNPPDDEYQLKIINDLEVDVLGGGGINRSSVNSQILLSSWMSPAVLIVKIVGIVAVTILFIIAANVAWQHYYCEQQWGRCNPLQVVPCDPVVRIEADQAMYIELAKEYQEKNQ